MAVTVTCDDLQAQNALQTIGICRALNFQNFLAGASNLQLTNCAVHSVLQGLNIIGTINIASNRKSFNLSSLSYAYAANGARGDASLATTCTLKFTAYVNKDGKQVKGTQPLTYTPRPSMTSILTSGMQSDSIEGENQTDPGA